jgi:hypothetical protein
MENVKIAKKLVAVMNECSHVTKNVVNTFQFTKACLSLRIFLFSPS